MGLRWSKIEKNGGPRGGPRGGGIRQEILFEFFAFQNRAQGSGTCRVRRGDIFHPPLGYPPWYAQEGFDKAKISEIFGTIQKKSNNIIFPKSTPKTYFESLGPQLPFYDVFLTDSLPAPTGKASKTTQTRVKISQFSPKTRAFSPKKNDYS